MDGAVRVFNTMINNGLVPNMYSFTKLVDALCKEGNVKDAKHVVEIMIQRGENPDAVTYNGLMHEYCLRGEIDGAVLKTMVNRGIVPNSVSYNILINGYCKKMKVDEAMHLFREMPHRGLKPKIETYNTILQGYFR